MSHKMLFVWVQGSYGSWKTWKVLEFYYGIFQDWKVLEKDLESSGNLLNSTETMKFMEDRKEN